ncbi:MAG TPA: cation transporter [Candidatus Coprovivens excrementavium]|nr:cation transporter [Candidatus Coprovivens excrementavium]
MKRFKVAKQASVLGILGNLFLFIIKMIVALLSSSQAMIADAMNSASDILSSIMTYIGNKVASVEADEDHNLGHGKAEYIYSMLISITMIILGGKILIDSFLSLIKPSQLDFSIWLIVVCLVTIVVKLCLYLYTNKLGKKYNNLLLEANSKDHRNDCVITLFNLLSALFYLWGIKFFDGVVGIGISLWIVYTGFSIFKSSYDVLMDKTFSFETKDKVMKIIEKYDEIKKINHFNATPVGYLYQVSFSIFVDGNMSTFESHKIANDLEREIEKKVPEIYLTVIHVNPYEEKDNEK